MTSRRGDVGGEEWSLLSAIGARSWFSGAERSFLMEEVVGGVRGGLQWEPEGRARREERIHGPEHSGDILTWGCGG